MSAPPADDVVRADPALRRRALLGAAAIVACVLALVSAPRSVMTLVRLVQDTPAAGARGIAIMLLFAAPFTLLAVVVAADAIRRSVRTLRAGQFPPPGTRVVRDTRIVRGRPATVVGAAGLALGGTLLVAALVLPWIAYRIGRVLQYGCPRAHVAATR